MSDVTSVSKVRIHITNMKKYQNLFFPLRCSSKIKVPVTAPLKDAAMKVSSPTLQVRNLIILISLTGCASKPQEKMQVSWRHRKLQFENLLEAAGAF